MIWTLAATESAGFWDFFMRTVNAICRPAPFISLAIIIFVLMLVLYKKWTKPKVATVRVVARSSQRSDPSRRQPLDLPAHPAPPFLPTFDTRTLLDQYAPVKPIYLKNCR